MNHAKAFAKINLGLVVGALRADGKHDIVTVLQRIELHDDITLEPAAELTVEGFEEDTIVRRALELLADAAGVEPRWRVAIDKQIPVASGLGGGSSDAATALLLANAELRRPVESSALHRVAAETGADVPFFLRDEVCVATGDGTELALISLPADYHVVLVVPHGDVKESTGHVYAAFDAANGASGFAERAATLDAALASIEGARDLATIPPNDLASSPVAQELEAAGAFRADVSGAGPTVYGLFERVDDATRAAEIAARAGHTYVTRPVEAGRSPRVAR
jgi:4-diphosphocytidyl-2-C-methyl-D-erythritol kinase